MKQFNHWARVNIRYSEITRFTFRIQSSQTICTAMAHWTYSVLSVNKQIEVILVLDKSKFHLLDSLRIWCTARIRNESATNRTTHTASTEHSLTFSVRTILHIILRCILCTVLNGCGLSAVQINQLEMWANAQPDGRPAEYR